jgi:hypothetical protein
LGGRWRLGDDPALRRASSGVSPTAAPRSRNPIPQAAAGVLLRDSFWVRAPKKTPDENAARHERTYATFEKSGGEKS